MTCRTVRMVGPHVVDIIDEAIPEPRADQVLVATIVSAISAGTESLLYRGEVSADLAMDETIPALAGRFAYPMTYGYAAAGRVARLGAGVPADWQDRLVFAFQPHTSHFLSRPDDLVPVDAPPEAVAMLPFVETAVNFLLDGAPLIGERVVVVGQGVVGLLTTALLARCPLRDLVSIEPLAARREWSRRLGARQSLDPHDAASGLHGVLGDNLADLSYELSGQSSGLDLAIAATGYAGRVVIGSWYGRRPVSVSLGGQFHRSKQHLIASQVSRVAPGLSGRWTPRRRLETAAALLPALQPDRLITHRFPVERAADGYRLIVDRQDAMLQVVLTY